MTTVKNHITLIGNIGSQAQITRFENGKRIEGEKSIAKGAAKGLENLHLITYEIPTNTYQDHGPIFFKNGERPLYVNSISVDAAKNVYTLARVNQNGKIITDLIKINLFT